MAKKAVTIPKVDDVVYDNIKKRCDKQGVPVGDFLREVLEKVSYDEEVSDVAESINTELLDELREENESLRQELSDAKAAAELSSATEKTEFETKIKALEDEKRLLESQLEALQLQKNEEVKADKNTVKVGFSELEFALIRFISERERRRTGENITPASLLRDMFINYSIKGEMWFFKYPTRDEILMLKKQIEQKQNENESND